MTPTVRRIALTAHVTSSVGWLGAVVAYLALAVHGLTGGEAATARAAFLSMELIGFYVIVPLSLATFATGLLQSLATEWGLFRHYWIIAKLAIAVVGTVILLVHMNTAVTSAAAIAADTSQSLDSLGHLRPQLVVHAGGGLIALVVATVLSIFKPWGKTGWRRAEKAA